MTHVVGGVCSRYFEVEILVFSLFRTGWLLLPLFLLLWLFPFSEDVFELCAEYSVQFPEILTVHLVAYLLSE